MAGLSVLVPVYNEADNLIALRDSLTATLLQLGHDWEVVLANDGSTDGSTDILNQIGASDPRFKIVHLRRNYGQTAALMAALDHSSGDIIVMIDADLQNDPADIGRLLNKLEEGYDVVSGWRQGRSDAKWTRQWPSQLASKFISWMSGVYLHDYGCTLKAYRRWTIDKMRLYGEMHRYIPIYANWEGAKITEVPVAHHARLHGESKYGLSRIPRVVLDLLVIFFLDRAMDRPMQFFGLAGLYLLGIAFLVGLYALWLRFGEGWSFIQTPLPLLFVFLTITAFLCFFLGVLAEIQIRTYFESLRKARLCRTRDPQYRLRPRDHSVCGIVGFTRDPRHPSAIDAAVVRRMLAPIAHRGPDETAIHVERHIAFGHLRLAIVDLDGGRQPRVDQATGDALVFNGEIYDFAALARRTRECGRQSRRSIRYRGACFGMLQRYGVQDNAGKNRRHVCLCLLRGEAAAAFFSPEIVSGKSRYILLERRRRTDIWVRAASRARSSVESRCSG